MPQYLCRVCDNSSGWVSPTHSATETTYSHFGNFGFGYEEWNFSSLLLIAGWQYGWIEGFKSGPGRRLVMLGLHEVVLYVRRNGQSFAVGKLLACEKLVPAAAPVYPAALAVQANGVGAAISLTGNTWNVSPTAAHPRMPAYAQIPIPNVRFKLKNACLFATPIPLPISFTRYGALLVTPTNGRAAIWSMVP